jgi:hypothetical protein
MTAVDNEIDALRTAMEFVLGRKVTMDEARTVADIKCGILKNRRLAKLLAV